ncbi:hypothetical protein ES703_83621 [subsurface metagenome]
MEWFSEIKGQQQIIALTPEVCYQLDKAGIEYSIIEDYYDEADLTALEDEYHESQLRWIESLDKFLQNNIKELKDLNLRLGTVYYSYLKTMVLDPLYIRCYTLNRLFEVIKPSNVVFISYSPKEMPLDFRLQDDGKSHYSQLVPILCRRHGVPLTSNFLKRNKINLEELIFVDVKTRLGRTLSKLLSIKRLFSARRHISKSSHQMKPTNEGGLNILILKTDHIGTDFIEDVLERGHDIYQLSGDFILKYSSPGVRRHLNLKAKYEGKVADLNNNIWESIANLLDSDDLIKWINEKCQADVSPLVLPRLKYFISKVCPEVLGYFKVFTDFYQNEKIDFVLTPHEVSLAEFAAVAAASHYSHTRSVYICHGDSIFDNKFWHIAQLSHFNINIATNKEMKEYFKYQCETNNIPTELYSSPHRLLNVKRIGYLREKQKGNAEKRIVYLPTMLMGDTRRLDGASYPDTWYYEFQKSLIEYFSTKSGYTFVWKGLPVSDAIYNPIPNFIRDNNFSNIEIAANSFVQHLPSADRVICDYPSTGFYESVVAGVPTMCLCHKAFILRKSAVEYFGNLLRLYSDIPEAIKHIDEFLDSDPELYKTTIEMGRESVLHILESVGGKR